MQVKLVSTENGFHDFDITDAGTIRRVTVSEDIKRGDMFNIYYGDGSYIPHRKEGAIWQGSKGVNGDLIGDLEKSIRKSDVFIGESVDSESFCVKATNNHCQCNCETPYVNYSQNEKDKVLAVDLDHADYGRNSSRYIYFLGTCGACSKPLTYARSFGSFHSNGLEGLKQLAEKEARVSIDWDSVITSIDDL